MKTLKCDQVSRCGCTLGFISWNKEHVLPQETCALKSWIQCDQQMTAMCGKILFILRMMRDQLWVIASSGDWVSKVCLYTREVWRHTSLDRLSVTKEFNSGSALNCIINQGGSQSGKGGMISRWPWANILQGKQTTTLMHCWNNNCNFPRKLAYGPLLASPVDRLMEYLGWSISR